MFPATEIVHAVGASGVGPPGAVTAFLPVELASRLQFGWTISVHIIFAMLSIGLAPFIVYFTYKEVIDGSERYAKLRNFWVKVFAVGFVMGTVTGIPMSFQFGTNFPGFSEFAGELIGGPLAFEAQMAFFLEAVFLGVLLFGRERVSERVYVASSVLVGIGAWLSAFWILVVNSWMQTPQGYELVERNGETIAQLTDPLAAIFTPRLPWMYLHTVTAAVVAVALLVGGISAYLVWKKREANIWRGSLRIAVVLLLLAAPFQAIQGDAYGRHVADTQPQKFAAMEGHYETGSADLELIAIPTEFDSLLSPDSEDVWSISVPGLGSFLATGNDFNAELTGLNEYDKNPPVPFVFWSFRLMVGLGFLFIALAVWGGYLAGKRRLKDSDRFLQAMMLSTPLGFVAILTGWYVTEIGRQPWIVQGVVRTGEAVSTSLTSLEATGTLAVFIGVYILLITAFLYVLKWLIEDELNRLEGEESSRQSGWPDVPVVGSDD